MKKFFIAIFIFSLFLGKIFADETTYINKSWYELYKEIIQSDQYCAQYKKTDSSFKNIVNLDESKYFIDLDSSKAKNFKIWDDLKTAKKDFEKNMDTIFGCATYSAYYRALETIQKDLIKNNSKLKWRLESKLKQKMNELKNKASKLEWKCKINSDTGFVKKAVLQQTTYEFCKYNYYLEYLKDRSYNISNIVDTNQSVWINVVTQKFDEKINAINIEMERANNAFPTALKAFADFENNISAHILLELLKEDYIVFRKWLHKTLNPINQVVYKISNAMRK